MFELERFDEKGDFRMWKYKILTQLEIQGLSSVLQEEVSEKSSDVKDEEEKDEKEEKEVNVDPRKADKDLRVRSLLGTCLLDTILRKIMHKKTALGMWQELERDYQTKSLPNRIYLKQMFASYKMEEGKSIEENIDMFLKLITDLVSLEISISYKDQAIQVLSGLPSQYEPLVHTLKYGMGKDMLTLHEVVTSAYAKEVELKQKGLLGRSRSCNEGLNFEDRGRSDKRGKQSKGRGSSRNRYRSKSRDSKDAKSKAC